MPKCNNQKPQFKRYSPQANVLVFVYYLNRFQLCRYNALTDRHSSYNVHQRLDRTT